MHRLRQLIWHHLLEALPRIPFILESCGETCFGCYPCLHACYFLLYHRDEITGSASPPSSTALSHWCGASGIYAANEIALNNPCSRMTIIFVLRWRPISSFAAYAGRERFPCWLLSRCSSLIPPTIRRAVIAIVIAGMTALRSMCVPCAGRAVEARGRCRHAASRRPGGTITLGNGRLRNFPGDSGVSEPRLADARRWPRFRMRRREGAPCWAGKEKYAAFAPTWRH